MTTAHRRITAPALGAGLLSLLLVPAAVARAQPPFFAPKEGFYGARGTAVKAAWSVDRDTVPEDGALTATLTVRGAANPGEIVRPDLNRLAAFGKAFQVEDVPGGAVPPDAQEVAFVYRLRPRNRDVDRLPSLDFYYLNPARTVGDPFENARARGVNITVTAAAPKPKPAAIPLDAPDHLFAVETGPRVLGREPFAPGLAGWGLLAGLGPLAAGLWYAVWRRAHPEAARAIRARRSRKARVAVAVIRKAGRAPDPAAVIAAAVVEYLRTRFPFPPGAETPPEVGAGLTAAGLPDDAARAVVAFLRRCDAARFAPAADTGASLAAEAEGLVARLEGVE